MLIYHNRDGELYVTQVMHGYTRSSVTTHRRDMNKVPESHLKSVKALTDNTVYVTGSSSVLGDGTHDRFTFRHYIDHMHEEPDQPIYRNKKRHR